MVTMVTVLSICFVLSGIFFPSLWCFFSPVTRGALRKLAAGRRAGGFGGPKVVGFFCGSVAGEGRFLLKATMASYFMASGGCFGQIDVLCLCFFLARFNLV